MPQGSHSWYLLYCKSNEETRAGLHLQNQGIEFFHPQRAVKKIRKGVRSVQLESLFPNYLFVKLDPSTANFNAIRSTRGVAQFVRFGTEYATVCDAMVDSLRLALAPEEHSIDERSLPKEGDVVTITQGIYQGLEAIYQTNDGLERSVLLIKMIEQQAKLSLDNKDFSITNK